MKTSVRLAALLLVCLFASPLLAGDCSQLSSQIAALKNNPKELRGLLQKDPQCGEVWEALGDFFYEKKVWNEAYTHYQEASKYLPGNRKLASRLNELGPKVTALIRNEEDLLAYRRAIGGVAKAPAQSSGPSSDEAPIVIASNTQARSSTTSAAAPKDTVRSKQARPAPVKVAAKSKPSAQVSRDVRAKAEKVGFIIHFAYNSADLTPEGRKLLSGFAEMLNMELAGKRFVIQGHTDNLGGEEHNMRLSEERAKAVLTYLSRTGVDASRLEIKGYGFEKPIYDNNTEDGRSKNRRVEFEER